MHFISFHHLEPTVAAFLATKWKMRPRRVWALCVVCVRHVQQRRWHAQVTMQQIPTLPPSSHTHIRPHHLSGAFPQTENVCLRFCTVTVILIMHSPTAVSCSPPSTPHTSTHTRVCRWSKPLGNFLDNTCCIIIAKTLKSRRHSPKLAHRLSCGSKSKSIKCIQYSTICRISLKAVFNKNVAYF